MPILRTAAVTPPILHTDFTLPTKGKGIGNVFPRTGHEVPKGEQRYSSTLSLTSALDEVGGQRHAPVLLPPGKRPGTHRIGGEVGPRTGQDGSGKSRHQDSIPGPSSP